MTEQHTFLPTKCALGTVIAGGLLKALDSDPGGQSGAR